MPELPEVETIRRQLEHELVGVLISRVTVRLPKIIRGSAVRFARLVRGKRILSIKRRGKYLYWVLQGGQSIMLHLKMTGQLIYRRGRTMRVGGHPIPRGTDGLPNRYTHVVFQFSNGGTVYFNDLRQFGFLELLPTPSIDQYFKKIAMGPEPLLSDFTLDYFDGLLKRRPGTTIKQLLLDQTAIAGIGNIYAIESLFRAHIKPMRRVKTITQAEATALYQSIKVILRRAVAAQGSSADRYVDAYGEPGKYFPRLQMYGRAGQSCHRCGTIIRGLKIGGRGTTYCPQCQR
ncbi:MAG: bifunctional DNA-formamidopyrimidine glycosylase/DNA-(apurinic or apyrimidinic site) lyase [Candidatus Kerfeldbacteria bacterium]|nr:bifunctional DNA-formamidopyrimidine glycosylase/DNA-(apurinic or apyrimidinic site) lyase [Candidatus Kerfeldbacteria bacterium]